MASGDGPTWPGPVTFDDNTPKNGFITIHLKIPELKISGNFLTGTRVNAEVKPVIKKDEVSVEVKFPDGPTYFYSKRMPEDINPDKSTHEVKKGKVELKLRKEKDTSWGAHASYLINKKS